MLDERRAQRARLAAGVALVLTHELLACCCCCSTTPAAPPKPPAALPRARPPTIAPAPPGHEARGRRRALADTRAPRVLLLAPRRQLLLPSLLLLSRAAARHRPRAARQRATQGESKLTSQSAVAARAQSKEADQRAATRRLVAASAHAWARQNSGPGTASSAQLGDAGRPGRPKARARELAPLKLTCVCSIERTGVRTRTSAAPRSGDCPCSRAILRSHCDPARAPPPLERPRPTSRRWI